MARTAPDGGCYDKTEFMLIERGDFTNEYKSEVLYTGRFDMENKHKTCETPLEDHITDFLDFQNNKASE
jgi:hypothetical protein